MAEAAWPSASGVSDPRTRAEANSAANRSPVPFGLIGSFGVRTRQALCAFDRKRLDLAGRRVRQLGAGDDDRRRPARQQRLRRVDHLIRCRGFRPAQPFELEMIGGDDIGKRQQPVAHQRRDVGLDEQAAVAIAEHGIAAIEQGGMARLGARDEVRDHSGDLGRAEIARQDHFGAIERAALLDRRAGDRRRVAPPAPGRGWSA